MRPLLRASRAVAVVAAGALATTLVATVGAGPALAASRITLDPGALPRGADVATAHLEGTTIVDGAVRIPVSAPTVVLLGKSGTGYLVATATQKGSKGKVVRLEANGAATSLGKGDPYAAKLSSDGQILMVPKGLYQDATIMKVRSATTGAKVAKMRIAGYATALDAHGTTVLFSGYGIRGTQSWDTSTGEVTRLSRRIGAIADFGHDLLASYTKDTYDGGCTVVSRISNPSAKLWKSCDEAVTAFSVDGSHLATVNILTDGIGPNAVAVRTVTGALERQYQAKRRGYFGAISFESASTLLVEVANARKKATVRCTATACERAGDYSSAVDYLY